MEQGNAFLFLTISRTPRLGGVFRRGASAPGRWLAGVADGEMRLERGHHRLGAASGLGMQDLASRLTSEFANRQTYCRKRREQACGQRAIVEADDRQIARNGKTEPVRDAVDTCGHFVVTGEDRAGPGIQREQLFAARDAGFIRVAALDDEFAWERNGARCQRFAKSGEALDGRTESRRAGDVADP